MSGVFIANALALVASLAWLATLALPLRQALRVRNALLLRRGAVEDVAWSPDQVPADFRVERRVPPEPIAVVSASHVAAGRQDDWSRARALVAMLVRHWRHEGHARADLTTTWNEIVAGGGSCSDYVRVYLAAAAGVGLFCRQWAFSFDGFGAHGHTFVEVYDRQLARWVFLDVHNNVYAVGAGSETPLDALSLRRAMLGKAPAAEFRQAGEGRLGWEHFDRLTDYYRGGAREWYLWWGNDVITRDTGGRWGHRLASALGRLPPLVALVTPENEAAVARMERLRRDVRLCSFAVIALATMLLAQMALHAWEGGRG